jgi:hypothetical protein
LPHNPQRFFKKVFTPLSHPLPSSSFRASHILGSSTNGRASKAHLDFYLSDFDRAAIVSAIELENGHPLTFDDMAGIEIIWSLFSNGFQG